jgi:hypothetical protein
MTYNKILIRENPCNIPEETKEFQWNGQTYQIENGFIPKKNDPNQNWIHVWKPIWNSRLFQRLQAEGMPVFWRFVNSGQSTRLTCIIPKEYLERLSKKVITESIQTPSFNTEDNQDLDRLWENRLSN